MILCSDLDLAGLQIQDRFSEDLLDGVHRASATGEPIREQKIVRSDSGYLSAIFALLHHDRKEIRDRGTHTTGNLLLANDTLTRHVLHSSLFYHLLTLFYGASKEESCDVMWEFSNLAASETLDLLNTIKLFGIWPFVSWALKKCDHKVQLRALWVLDSVINSPEKTEVLPVCTQLDFFECLVKIPAAESKSDLQSQGVAASFIKQFLEFLENELDSDKNVEKTIETYRSAVDVIYNFVCTEPEALCKESCEMSATLKSICESVKPHKA